MPQVWWQLDFPLYQEIEDIFSRIHPEPPGFTSLSNDEYLLDGQVMPAENQPAQPKALRILHVVPTYVPAWRYGGPIRSVHGLCRALASSKHDVHVFTTNVDGDGELGTATCRPIDVEGVKVWYFPCSHLRRLYYSRSMLRSLRTEIRHFDIVHLHSIFLWPTWAAARVARREGVPYLVSPKGMLVRDLVRRKNPWIKGLWISLIERRNLKHASRIHVTSQGEAEALTEFSLELPPVFELRNGVDVPEKWTLDDVSEDVRSMISHQPYVLFLGRINWKKGIDLLIKSWRGVSGAYLLIVGNDEDNYAPTLIELSEKLGVSEKLIFHCAPVLGADREALFSFARAFVLPSYSENFGNTISEAMIRGVPVILTEDVGAREIVEQAKCGYVVSADQIQGAITNMLSNQKKSVALGKRGRDWARSNLQWSSVSKDMVDRYREILASQ
jgi:glycosyltransferase involved in cell wall biosynthesis